MNVEYIYPTWVVGNKTPALVKNLTHHECKKVLLITPRVTLAARLRDLRVLKVECTVITIDNAVDIVTAQKDGVYVITYTTLQYLDGKRPFFDMVIYDETSNPKQLLEQRCARLIRPCTKVVVSFNPPQTEAYLG